jgi:hypothetical protein
VTSHRFRRPPPYQGSSIDRVRIEARDKKQSLVPIQVGKGERRSEHQVDVFNYAQGLLTFYKHSI